MTTDDVGGGGHVMNVIKKSDGITIYDGQSGKTYIGEEAQKFLSDANPGRLVYSRVDNLDLDQRYTPMCVTPRQH